MRITRGATCFFFLYRFFGSVQVYTLCLVVKGFMCFYVCVFVCVLIIITLMCVCACVRSRWFRGVKISPWLQLIYFTKKKVNYTCESPLYIDRELVHMNVLVLCFLLLLLFFHRINKYRKKRKRKFSICATYIEKFIF